MFSAKPFLCLLLAISVSSIYAQVDVKNDASRPFPKQRYTLGEFREENPEFYYLPKTMTPESYVVTLEPFIDQNAFDGNVTIRGKNAESIKQIVMHILAIKIHDLQVKISDKLVGNALSFDKQRQFLVITLGEDAPANSEIEINIRYSGEMNDQYGIYGLYIATYTDGMGVQKRMVTSHNEPVHARRIFPCFDEPALKARITLNIVRPKIMMSATNMPIQSTESWPFDDSKEVDHFEPTPLMSTYLVVVIVSEYSTMAFAYRNAAHFLHADKTAIEKGYADLAFSSSYPVLSALEQYTGVSYDLPKIGQVAIPRGFFGGAMENWGLVIYGELSLLFKPNVSTEIQRAGVISIMAHEYAHQWFGNLVGPQSWAYTWLNEGFAAYFTMRIPTMVHPDWRYDEQFVFKIPSVMRSDSTAYTRPMTMPVGSPANIQSTFDVIAYDKSSCVIRMFEHVLGTPNFKRALNIYLNNRKYKGATADDVIAGFEAALQEVNSPLAKDIRDIFNTWHLQKGFPLVTAIRNYEDNTVTFHQERFMTDGTKPDEIFSIPINYFLKTSTAAEKADTSAQVWLTQKSLTIQLPEEAKDSFLILNKGYTGYYRVNYDEENWKRIYSNDRAFLDMPKNRVQLLEDAFALKNTGLVNSEIALRLFSAIQLDDDNYLVAKSSMKYFDWLYEMYHDDQNIMDYLIKTYRKVYDLYSNVHQHDGDYIETLMRDEILKRMCRINDVVCLTQMSYHMWEEKIFKSPNLQQSVLCAGFMNNTDAHKKFEFIQDRIFNEREADARERLMQAFPCTKSPDIGKKVLDWIVHPRTNIFNINPHTLMYDYCKDIGNSKIALEYSLENFKTLVENYNEEDLSYLISLATQNLNSEADVMMIEDYLASNSLTPKQEQIFHKAINVIKTNINDKIPVLIWH